MIGSGATTATVVLAIAVDCEHITVLQRSPTYFTPTKNENVTADHLRKLGIDEAWIHEIVRREVLFNQDEFTQMAIEHPEEVKKELLEGVKACLPEGYDMKHFTPSYRPWQQRLAFVTDGDLFQGISAGEASMVIDEVERYTKTGVSLKSGQEIEADIVVTATGFNLCVLGDINFSVDGKQVDFADTVTYRGMMFTGVPNMAWVFGYFRASWALRADLVGDFVCQLLNHMAEKGMHSVMPTLRAEDQGMPRLDWIDSENFNPNYLQRSMHLIPKRGDKPEWMHNQGYWKGNEEIPIINLYDAAFAYQ